MILIGFTWVFVATAAALLITPVTRGRWEDHGPTVMMVAATGSFFGGMLGAAISNGIDGYGPASGTPATLGVLLSIAGGLAGFVAYVVDVKKRVRA